MPKPIVPVPAEALPRFDTVDVLRGLSILAVILLHGRLRVFFEGFSLKGTLPQWLLHLLFSNGDNGVIVFFAVSGFLITLTSMRRFGGLRNMRVRGFYRIRFARIAPPLLLVLAVLSMLHLVHADGFRIAPNRGTLAHALFAALTFHLNWWEGVKGYLPANWDVLWSLSVEEMFYLFFPLVCAVLLRRRFGMPVFLLLLTAFVVMGPFARAIWTAYNPVWQEKSYLGGMDAIAMGCLTALLVDRLRSRAPRPSLLLGVQILGAALMLLIAIYPRFAFMRFLGRTTLDSSALPLGTCMVMLASVLRGAPGSRWTAPLRWFGRQSYELYLTHEFGIVWLTAALVALRKAGHATGPVLAWIAVMLAVSVPVGWAMARFWSEPLNRRLRERGQPHADEDISPEVGAQQYVKVEIGS